MGRTGNQNRGPCLLERFDESGRRKNVDQAGGGTNGKAEFKRVKSVEVCVRREAEDAVVRLQPVLSSAQTGIAEIMIEADRNCLGRRRGARGIEKKKRILGARPQRSPLPPPALQQSGKVERSWHVTTDRDDTPQCRNAVAQRSDLGSGGTVLRFGERDRCFTATMGDQVLKLSSAVGRVRSLHHRAKVIDGEPS